MSARKCIICRKSDVIGSYWVCPRCYNEYGLKGLKQKDWPDWVKALGTIEQRNERHELETVQYDDQYLYEEYEYE